MAFQQGKSYTKQAASCEAVQTTASMANHEVQTLPGSNMHLFIGTITKKHDSQVTKRYNKISICCHMNARNTWTWLIRLDSTRPDVVKEVSSLALSLICFRMADKIC